MLDQFCLWLGKTPVSDVIQNVTWIIPLVQTIHILSVSIVLSSIGMLDLRLLGVAGRRVSISGMAERFLPWIWGALVVLLISGVILIVGEPSRDLPNVIFQLKMALLAAVLVVTVAFQHTVRRDANFWDLSPAHRHSAKVTAGISIALWVAIAVCGRFIAYVDAQH
jgi:uncharacterized membrane protein